MLRRRGYTLSATSEPDVEAIPEAPGTYILTVCGSEGCRVLGVWTVRDPWLRTDVIARLAAPEVAVHLPSLVAYRVLGHKPDDGVLRYQARLAAEQAEVVEALRSLS